MLLLQLGNRITMGKTYKDSKYRPQNLNRDKLVGKKGEKKVSKKKDRGATKKQLEKYK